jgi:hypothetical protein
MSILTVSRRTSLFYASYPWLGSRSDAKVRRRAAACNWLALTPTNPAAAADERYLKLTLRTRPKPKLPAQASIRAAAYGTPRLR